MYAVIVIRLVCGRKRGEHTSKSIYKTGATCVVFYCCCIISSHDILRFIQSNDVSTAQAHTHTQKKRVHWKIGLKFF